MYWLNYKRYTKTLTGTVFGNWGNISAQLKPFFPPWLVSKVEFSK